LPTFVVGGVFDGSYSNRGDPHPFLLKVKPDDVFFYDLSCWYYDKNKNNILKDLPHTKNTF
jgi:hypothetical protein